MKKVYKNKFKIRIWILIILFISVVIISLCWHYFKINLHHKNSPINKAIDREVKNLVLQSSDSLYHISYNTLDINIDSGYGTITGLKVHADPVVYSKLSKEYKAPDVLIDAEINNIHLSHIKVLRDGQNQVIDIGEIKLDTPGLKIIVKHLQHDSATAILTSRFYLFKAVSDLLRMQHYGIFIHQAILKNLDVEYINNNGSKRSTKLKGLDMQLGAIQFNNDPDSDHNRFFSSINLDNYRITLPGNIYFVDLKGVQYNQEKNSIFIHSITLLPRLSKLNFNNSTDKANERYHLVLRNSLIEHLDVKKWSYDQRIHIPQITSEYGWADIFTNYNAVLHTPPLRRHAYPIDQLKNLAFDLTIDKLNVKDGDVYHTIVAQRSGREAILSLRHLKATFDNITNDKLRIRTDNYMTANISAMILDAGKVNVSYKFNLKDKSAPFALHAILGSIDGPVLNSLLEPLALIEIKSGRFEKMDAFINADEYHATGNVDMFYKGLKVNLLKPDKTNGDLKSRPILSFLANSILPNDNPNANGKFRKGPVNIIRQPRESFLGFTWKALLDGMSSAIIGTNQIKNKPKNIVTKLGKLFSGRKKRK